MYLLLAEADGHPALEQASWVVAIVAFVLVVLQLFFYWFGRNVPLQIRAVGQVVKASSGELLRLDMTLRSRTRETQTVRDVLLFKPPSWLVRSLWPWWFRKTRPVVPASLSDDIPLTVEGHDVVDLRVGFDCTELPYGKKTRLRVRASRRRPHVVKVRLKQPPSARPAVPAPPSREVRRFVRVWGLDRVRVRVRRRP